MVYCRTKVTSSHFFARVVRAHDTKTRIVMRVSTYTSPQRFFQRAQEMRQIGPAATVMLNRRMAQYHGIRLFCGIKNAKVVSLCCGASVFCAGYFHQSLSPKLTHSAKNTSAAVTKFITVSSTLVASDDLNVLGELSVATELILDGEVTKTSTETSHYPKSINSNGYDITATSTANVTDVAFSYVNKQRYRHQGQPVGEIPILSAL